MYTVTHINGGLLKRAMIFISCAALQNGDCSKRKELAPRGTLVNVYVDLVVFTRIAGTS